MRSVVAIALCLLAGGSALGQTKPSEAPSVALPKDYVLLTIFLKHDQSKTLDEINAELAERSFMKEFPPNGVEVESWYVMMGIGQVVTLRVPPEKLRELNRVIEQKAWSAYTTEFYLTYDIKEAMRLQHGKAVKGP